MGIVSIEQTDRLYWLGRYSERVYTTIRLYLSAYDTMIDRVAESYKDFCKQLNIPQIYTSAEDFMRRYPFDESDFNSIMSNLKRAYDNAIVLREEIGSEALSYIQLCIYEMQKAAVSNASILEFQRILDNIAAFWGICDDQIPSENIRNILKVGKRIERIDLFGRLHRSKTDLARETARLAGRVQRCRLNYNPAVVENLLALTEAAEMDYPKIVEEAERFLEV